MKNRVFPNYKEWSFWPCRGINLINFFCYHLHIKLSLCDVTCISENELLRIHTRSDMSLDVRVAASDWLRMYYLLLLYLSRVYTKAARMFIPMWASQQLLVTSNINLTGGHLYSHKQYIYLPFGIIDWIVSPFTSASVFLLSHRILLCARVVALSEKASTIQHGYRKWRTHARVFSKHLRMGTAKMK